jgi:hypothetical protein
MQNSTSLTAWGLVEESRGASDHSKVSAIVIDETYRARSVFALALTPSAKEGSWASVLA